MDLIKGVVEAISCKEIPEDRFGNTYRFSIKVGEDWIGLGSGKKPDIGVKEGDSWYTLKKGDEVALVVEENNGYLNGQKKTLKVTKKGSAPQKSTSSSSAPSQGVQRAPAATSGVDWAAKDAGAAASASIDKALKYIELRKGEVKTDYATILSIARDMQNMVKTLASEIQHGTSPSEKAFPPEKPKPTPASTRGRSKPAPVEPDESDFDDSDIPF